MENASLKLLTPAPQDKLDAWLSEVYGKPVKIVNRELLRHRDLSLVERLTIEDALPSTIIYKLVLPPWDIEQDLHERILVPSVSSSARLFLAAHYDKLTALFLEDMGRQSLLTIPMDAELAAGIGKDLAKLHRAYSYRVEELIHMNVLRHVRPVDYAHLTEKLCKQLAKRNLIERQEEQSLLSLAELLGSQLQAEPISLVHGDLYAENILVRENGIAILDWSWFTIVGVPLMDLATLASNHPKNGPLYEWRTQLIESYAFEAGRKAPEIHTLLPYAEKLSRLFFLNWLVERRVRGIMGTTVGPVDDLIAKVITELAQKIQAQAD